MERIPKIVCLVTTQVDKANPRRWTASASAMTDNLREPYGNGEGTAASADVAAKRAVEHAITDLRRHEREALGLDAG